MLEIIAIINFITAVLAFIWGITTEYKQSRQDGPVAIVATLPFGVAAALSATIGTAALVGRDLPLWVYLLMFFGLAIACGFAINSASANRSSKSDS